MIFHIDMYWSKQNINQSLNSQKTLHSLASRASYEVSIVRIWEKTDRAKMTPYCISQIYKDL